MTMKAWQLTVAVPTDRKRLVVEVFFGDCQWAELNQEANRMEVEFYARPDGQPWRIALADAIAALREAEGVLLARSSRGHSS